MQERIAVIGVGCVGLPLALALSERYEEVIGYDVDQDKVRRLKEGADPNFQRQEGRPKRSKVHFTTTLTDLLDTSFFIVTVPTLLSDEHTPDLTCLRAAAGAIGRIIQKGAIVVFESTVYPGVTEEFCGPIIEEVSGLKQGLDFKLGYSPERMNPGDPAHTIAEVTKLVAGEDEETLSRISSVYGSVVREGVHQAPSIKVAEAAKVIENIQRDLNVALMNELALIFDKLGISTRDVLAAARTKWNFNHYTPGLVGGNCVSVDPYYLTSKAEQLGYHPQVILAGRRINDEMGRWIAQKMVKLLIAAGITPKGSMVGILGVTFKEDVSDIRNSRVPDIYHELRDFGVAPLIWDPVVDSDEAEDAYDIHMASSEQLHNLDGLILAVPHREFLDAPPVELWRRLRKGGPLMDIKSALDPSATPEGYRYWSL